MRPSASMVEVPAAPQRPTDDRAAEPRRLAINFLFLSCGEFTAKLLTFASFSYLARQLGAWNYGLLEFTLAIMVFSPCRSTWDWDRTALAKLPAIPRARRACCMKLPAFAWCLALCSMLALGVFIAADSQERRVENVARPLRIEPAGRAISAAVVLPGARPDALGGNRLHRASGRVCSAGVFALPPEDRRSF